MSRRNSNNIGSMIIGVIMFGTATAAWLYGETMGIDTAIIWTVVTPVVGALFLAGPVSQAAQASQQAAQQTNGQLDQRVTAAVSAALANRDAARTRQAQGDVSASRPTHAAQATPARSASVDSAT